MKRFGNVVFVIQAGICCLCFLGGCAALFGWNIHAPGILSDGFYAQVTPVRARIGLYLPEAFLNYQSRNRGGRFADPQTYYIGEAMTPMTIEAFNRGFEEFIFLETEPTDLILKRYGISHLVFLHIKSLENRVTLKGQTLEIATDIQVMDAEGNLQMRMEARGSSDAHGVFSKKGGPEVNLNAAIENNLCVTVQMLQDFIRAQKVSP